MCHRTGGYFSDAFPVFKPFLAGISLPAFSKTPGQGNWRWRNDDGDETTATWKAAENTPILLTHKNNIRLRVAIGNDNEEAVTSAKINLHYSYDQEANWFRIEDNQEAGHFVFGSSLFFTNQDLSTQPLVGLPACCNDFVDGYLFDTYDSENKYPRLEAKEGTELEFSIRATDNALDATEYAFRLKNKETFIFDDEDRIFEEPLRLFSGTTTITLTTAFSLRQVPFAPWALLLAKALIISVTIIIVRRFY